MRTHREIEYFYLFLFFLNNLLFHKVYCFSRPSYKASKSPIIPEPFDLHCSFKSESPRSISFSSCSYAYQDNNVYMRNKAPFAGPSLRTI